MRLEDGSLRVADRHGQALSEYHVAQGSSQDCGPHVVATAVNFYKGQSVLDPRTVAHEMNIPALRPSLIPLVVRRIPNWATFPWGISDELSAHGVPARWQLSASEDDLRRALEEDRLAMPIYGEPFRRQGWRWTGWSHVVILAGWDPVTEEYLFVDSSRRAAPTRRSRDEFLRLWGNLRRLLVETTA